MRHSSLPSSRRRAQGADMKSLSAAAILLLASTAGLAAAPAAGPEGPARVAAEARAWRASHERAVIQEFADLLAIPNLASDRPDIERNAPAAQALLERRGGRAQRRAGDGAPPLRRR